jgi:hypothetical protein
MSIGGDVGMNSERSSYDGPFMALVDPVDE